MLIDLRSAKLSTFSFLANGFSNDFFHLIATHTRINDVNYRIYTVW